MSEEPERRPPLDASTIDDLVARTRGFLREIANDYIKRPIDDLLKWTLGRAIAYLVAAGFFVTAVVFLMIAGVEGLRAAEVSPVWAYLGSGIAGILAGLIVLRATRPSSGKK